MTIDEWIATRRQTRASETPVLPPNSTTRWPGFSLPVRPPARIIARAMRSFMLPVGLALSSLPGCARVALRHGRGRRRDQRRIADLLQDRSGHIGISLVSTNDVDTRNDLEAQAAPRRRRARPWSPTRAGRSRPAPGSTSALAARRISNFLEAQAAGDRADHRAVRPVDPDRGGGRRHAGALAERAGLDPSTLSRTCARWNRQASSRSRPWRRTCDAARSG